MKNFLKLAGMLIFFGALAIVANASETAVSPRSLDNDPTIVFKGSGVGTPALARFLTSPAPDPPCSPPFCYNLEYTDPGTIVFFNVNPPEPANPPTYNCIATGGLICGVNVFEGQFFAVGLGGGMSGGSPFDVTLSITGGPINLVIPSSGITCLDNDCMPGNTVPLDPTPEPGTAMLYMSGLLLLACFLAKRPKTGAVRV